MLARPLKPTSAQACVRAGTTQHNRWRSAGTSRAERSRGERTTLMATKAIVGEKVGMTQVWDDANRVVPVTVVRVAPVRVVQVKTPESDGYSALQVTFGYRKPDKFSKPEAGHFAKAGVDPGANLVELRLDDVSDYEVGQEIKVDILEAGEKVDVTAVSKGKGFAGVMKRHGFSGLKASHGVERRSPLARRHRGLRHPRPGVQGHPHGRPHGRRAGDHAQPRGGRGRRRAQPVAREGRGARPQGRAGAHPRRGEGPGFHGWWIVSERSGEA